MSYGGSLPGFLKSEQKFVKDNKPKRQSLLQRQKQLAIGSSRKQGLFSRIWLFLTTL